MRKLSKFLTGADQKAVSDHLPSTTSFYIVQSERERTPCAKAKGEKNKKKKNSNIRRIKMGN
jgi:hypothetical protein